MKITSADYYPQEKCIFFRGNRQTYSCEALSECFCCTESEPCRFFKSKNKRVRQEPHYRIPKFEPKPQGVGTNTTLTREMTARIVEEQAKTGESWAEMARRNNVSESKLRYARKVFGFGTSPSMKTLQRAITREKVLKAIELHHSGMSWTDSARAVGCTYGALRAHIISEGLTELADRKKENHERNRKNH